MNILYEEDNQMKDEKFWTNKDGFFGADDFQELKPENLEGIAGGAVEQRHYDALKDYIEMSKGGMTKEQFKASFCGNWHSVQEFRTEFSSNGDPNDLKTLMDYVDKVW